MRDRHSTDLAGAKRYASAEAFPESGPEPADYLEGYAREVGWLTCACGTSSPHPYCPGCSGRLRAPHTAHEARWMVNHHYEPTPTDLRRFPEAFES
jgi:CDGSH-type Zn-finger protein